ncbi:hypothetical protein GCM10010214_57330 [Streptomyces abikoensis]|nr:hypothetical protein GCM10010214_57330 [Streptomyces abikoensis]
MQVEMGLGQQTEITRAFHCPILPQPAPDRKAFSLIGDGPENEPENECGAPAAQHGRNPASSRRSEP